jgi:uncharacterized membrane protein (UPF0127 family)
MVPISKALGTTLLLLALVALTGCAYTNTVLNGMHPTPSNSDPIVPTDASILSTISATPQQHNRSEVFIGGVNVYADLADTPRKQADGLMWRLQLNESEGMLFVFGGEESVSVWMKNMLIPIDVVFISSDMKIITVHTSVPPCPQDPCTSYASSKPAKYALEVSAGFCERHGVQPGDSISISGL